VDNPDTGGHVLTGTITSPTVGSNCPVGNTRTRCTATVDVSQLTIVNTASAPTSAPGGVVSYTITAANSGQAAFAGATLTVGLAPVLDDATYNGDAAATTGAVTLAGDGKSLIWTGNLAVGVTATITFSVTVNNPDTGDKTLTSTVASATPGTTSPPCRSTVGVLTPALTITSTADASTTIPGATVGYTITITDNGQTPYAGATVADSLAGVLDDAAYNGDAAATVGIVSYASPTLTWTGSLDPGDTATITFSATVSNPDTGDEILSTTATSAAAGNNCPSGSTDPNCSTTISVSVVTITNTASTSTATPGSTVSYTVTVSNTGRVDLTDLVFALPLSDVLDDAAYGNNATATEGLVLFAGSERLGGPDDVRVHAEGYRGDPAHHPARAEAVQSLGRPQPVL
jgi:large repetitive protein